MFYPQEVVSEVRALNDIVDVVAGYVKLTPRAGNHFGLCPFHNEKTPSFSVNRDKQIFYCFGCGKGGNVVNFIMQIENMDFPDALKLLADRVRFNLPEKGTSPSARRQVALRETAANLNKRAARFYYDYLNSENPDAKNARNYLDSRGIGQALRRRFGIGLSPPGWDGLINHLSDAAHDELAATGLAAQSRKGGARSYDRFRRRLMFPIIDIRNRVVGFGGRTFSDSDEPEAKYINTPETALFHKSEHLYGLNLAKKANSKRGETLIVEGYIDVIAMHAHGFTNTVGVLGTAMTDSHARLLNSAGSGTAVLILDSDEAGIRAALRAIPILTKRGIKIKILALPGAKDPDEYLNKFGARRFAGLLENAKSHIAFQVELLRKNFDLATTEGRVGFTQESAKILADLSSAIEIDAYVQEIAETAALSPSAIHAEINKLRNIPVSEFVPKVVKAVKRGKDIGLTNAKKSLLLLIFTYAGAADSLKRGGYLPPEEMGEDVYVKLLTLAYQNSANIQELTPAAIMDYLDSPEEQQVVAEIFSEYAEEQTRLEAQKILNETVKIIKIPYIFEKMNRAIEKNDRKTVESLDFERKNINSLNITITDG